MHECFYCGAKAVIWDADFSYKDCGIDGEGIIHNYRCTNCGVIIHYFVDTESLGESDV